MIRGSSSQNEMCVAILLPDGCLYKNILNEIQTWSVSEDYMAESFNNYNLFGTGKIVFVNKRFEVVK